MTIFTAQTIVLVIAAIGLIVWLTSLSKLRKAVRWKRPIDVLGAEEPSPESVSEDFYATSVVVAGEPRELLEKAASLIARETLSPFGPLKITERSDDSLSFDQVGTVMGHQHMSRWFRRGKLQFTSVGGGKCRIDYAIELSSLRWILTMAWIFQILGICILMLGAWALYHYVAPHHNLGVRFQVFQMFQAAHFLWPPFLFAILYTRGRKGVIDQFDAFVHNLPHSTL